MTSHPHFVFTGERIIPGDEGCQGILPEHLARYRFAQPFARTRRVLDAACGVGYGSALLAEAGAEAVVGVDIDGPSIDVARDTYGQTPGLRFIQADLRTLPDVLTDRFELCVSFETIEHLEEPERFLRNLRALLVPDGQLLLSTPNRYLYSPLNRDGRHSHNPFHRTEWTQRQFLSLLARDFEVVAVYGQLLWPGRKARVFHWKARAKQALRVPLLVPPYHALLAWRARHTHEKPQPCRLDPGDPVVSAAQERRVEVRPFGRDEVPLYLVCLCRNRR